MVNKFDINTKPLHKAKPCIVQLIRDDSTTEWYENAKAGQLLEIKSGQQKSYINLDYNKVLNFNADTSETELEEAQKIIDEIKKEHKDFEIESEKNTKSIQIELAKLRNLTLDPSITPEIAKKTKKAIEHQESALNRRINALKGKYVSLNKNKLKNFEKKNKPILGFVCYEKEFNALPYKAEHDSKSITQWMDDILKNKKDFQAQRTEAVGKVLLWVLLGGAVLAFVWGRWVAPNMAKEEVDVATKTVATLPLLFFITKKRLQKWLEKK